jgi:predicted DsbA family dithiol-disulfide isomerase
LTAYLSEGEAMSDHETLVRLAVEVGLDEDEVRVTLGSDTYAREVRADESLASRLGITGVPFFVFGGHLAVSGAQPVELFEEALARGWEENARELEAEPAPAAAEYGEGAACGPDGCS